MSRCAGAGREHSQADSQAGQGKYSIPWASCSVYEWGFAGAQEFSFSESSNFSVSSVCFQEFRAIHKICKFRVPRSLPGDWLCNWSSGSEEKNCIVYHLGCIFTIVIVSNSSVFLCCFIKLSLSQPTSFTFCPFSSSSCCGGRGERAAVWS